MKTIEEKARAYDEAIKRGLDYIRHTPATEMVTQQDILETIFPELAESEDKKIGLEIRNFIWNYPEKLPERDRWLAWFEKQKDYIKLSSSAYTSNRDINEFADNYSHTIWENLMDNFNKIENYSIGCNDVSDLVLNAIIHTYYWLEKQGYTFTKKDIDDTYLKDKCDTKHKIEKQSEQKLTNNIEPKFKLRDWITNGGANPCYVKSIFGDYYELCSCEGFKYTKHIIDVNYTYHLWSIDDANDGDILLSSEGYPFIFSGEYDDKHFGNPIAYCGVTCENKFKEGEGTHWTRKNGVVPATKAQQDMLFTKMWEAGYKWDAVKKELKKIDIKTIDCDKVIGWLQNYLSNVTCYGDIFVKQFKKDFGLWHKKS